jgi:MFS transporter, DHA1 family, multidrug resistance protein
VAGRGRASPAPAATTLTGWFAFERFRDVPETPSAPTNGRQLLRNPAFRAALAIAVVVALGFGLVVPILPAFAYSFGVSLFAASGIVSVFAGVRLASNFYTGALTDRIGTRQAVGWGAIVVAVSSVLAGAAPGYWWLLAFRGMGGFGSALFFNALLTHVIKLVPPDYRGRAVGMLQGAFLFGISVGPSVGGALAEPLGLRWPLVIYGVFCAAAAVVAFVGLPRADAAPTGGDAPAPPPGRASGLRPLLQTAARFCKDPAFVAALVMMAASRWASTGVRFSLIPLFGEEVVGTSTLVVGVALTLAALMHIAILYPAGKLIDTRGRRVLAAPAYLVYALASALLIVATDVPMFLLVMAFYGLGTGLTSVTPPALVGDITSPEDTGKAVGVLNTAGDLGSVLGPLVSGWLADQAGFGWGFGVSAGLLVVGAVFGARMRETLPQKGPERTAER